jgi:hypothetical protein
MSYNNNLIVLLEMFYIIVGFTIYYVNVIGYSVSVCQEATGRMSIV